MTVVAVAVVVAEVLMVAVNSGGSDNRVVVVRSIHSNSSSCRIRACSLIDIRGGTTGIISLHVDG